MKIPELAKKLEISPQKLREKILQFGFDIGKKTRTLKDETAKIVIDKITKERALLSATETPKETEIKQPEKEIPEEANVVEVPEILTVKDFASKLNLPVSDVIRELMKNKIIATINENIDYTTATIIAEDLGFKTKRQKAELIEKPEEEKADLKPKPPVVVIIGHVDHGKTKLLDAIRKTDIIATEAGGITQHLGAYQVVVPIKNQKRKITFLDTPGHEAFVSMRKHGAQIADIAVLVVAVDEGVKPQTIEAVNHAKSVGVPIIVGLNKIDLPTANLEKTKKELSEIGLQPEDWGGTTVMVPISAKKAIGIQEILEMIILMADLEKFQARFSGVAEGVVIESHMDPQKGSVATILIQKGELKIHQLVVIGQKISKIRIMEDFAGRKIKKALPSDPIRIYGIKEVPDYGEKIFGFETEKEAKNYLEDFIKKLNIKNLFDQKIASMATQKGVKELHLVVKADVAGSLKAILDSLEKLTSTKTQVKIVGSGVGDVSESDVATANASLAKIIGFKVNIPNEILRLCLENKVPVETYEVIYELIEDTKKDLEEITEPDIEEVEIGKAKILKIFRQSRRFKLLGACVTKGKIKKGAKIKVFRGDEEIGQGNIESLQIERRDRDEVMEGDEFGMNLVGDFKAKKEDTVVAFENQEKK